ncbi:EscE/YscE/SsaE family type III secretion system needle protein co-chaperone [Aeromonas salmonicida]|uniref:EscE/YscE/SsaE family type III secretion system needle protein co-chaperone n=1 Tax=Aeromonas salmonicida TaxID=645 RepID=UPI00259DE42F|nr:EscE/YscE/SsaE family type III secretion system needle protein co-chaperone [Aeromonas salmonicida]MDM5065586.1 EscE/YscE/SsaE family type III secretion system needle protein co-chaperone [Aeromonas salmonicida]
MARLTSLETRLYRDSAGHARDALLGQLAAAERHLTTQLRACQDAGQRQQITQLLAASAQAAQVIATLWHRYHVCRQAGW